MEGGVSYTTVDNFFKTYVHEICLLWQGIFGEHRYHGQVTLVSFFLPKCLIGVSLFPTMLVVSYLNDSSKPKV